MECKIVSIETAADTKPRSYSGQVSPAFYCTECNQCTQTTNYFMTPKFCAFCGSNSLITDKERTKIDMSASLHIPSAAFDFMYENFQHQSAYNDFRDYVNCMLKGKVPLTKKQELEQARKYL